MKKIAFITLGCRVNQYETQAVREALFARGFEEASFEEECDAYFVNTCAVTGESTRKGRQAIRRALRQKEKYPGAVLCVCGCFSQGAGEDAIFDNVDIVTGNTGKGSLALHIARLCHVPPEKREKVRLCRDISKVCEYEPLSVSASINARAFVKIQDGCNSFCTYCYVPLVRGRVRSRSRDEIVKEAHRLAQAGYREIVLVGIETGAYGQERGEKDALLLLVEDLHRVHGIERIRFGSLKPSLFTDEFCEKLASMEKVMPHFHLSLQSGSDAVLKNMGRTYTRAEEEAAISAIYRYFPDAGLSADLICGFPGEREEDFQKTVDLVKSAGLLHTHIFPFSPREGTRAARMTENLTAEEKKSRCANLLAVAKASSTAFAKKRVGREYRVLCERIRDGFAFGYTDNFIYTKFPAPSGIGVGDVVPVVLQEEYSFSVETMTVLAKSAIDLDNSGKK